MRAGATWEGNNHQKVIQDVMCLRIAMPGESAKKIARCEGARVPLT